MKNPGTGNVTPDVDPVLILDVLILDSRDSFTWNLAQAFMELGARVEVVCADDTHAAAILSARPRLVCVGPGPRGASPHLLDIVRALTGEVPLFGVCLGLQALVLAHGGAVARAHAPVHGKRDVIDHEAAGCLRGLPTPLWVMRYHSLVATTVPGRFAITARDAHGQPMALCCRAARVEAVQFHPESIGTAGGMSILRNVLVDAGMDVPAVVVRAGAVPASSSVGPGYREALYRAAEVQR